MVAGFVPSEHFVVPSSKEFEVATVAGISVDFKIVHNWITPKQIDCRIVLATLITIRRITTVLKSVTDR